MKNFLSKYNYEIKIISIYTICLAIVYGSLVYARTDQLEKCARIGFGILTSSMILIIGIIVGIIYIKHKEKQSKKDEDKE